MIENNLNESTLADSNEVIRNLYIVVFGCLCVCPDVTFSVTWSIVNNSAIWGRFWDIEVSAES